MAQPHSKEPLRVTSKQDSLSVNWSHQQGLSEAVNVSSQLCIQWHRVHSLEAATRGVFTPWKSAKSSAYFGFLTSLFLEYWLLDIYRHTTQFICTYLETKIITKHNYCKLASIIMVLVCQCCYSEIVLWAVQDKQMSHYVAIVKHWDFGE